ncbi:MAG: hypothetical protein F6K62_10870 [Sphaerospermopsis sp. SIO1G2]|nr:hypothetical protein [Sphaerospermopsis sp. SIO1G2]
MVIVCLIGWISLTLFDALGVTIASVAFYLVAIVMIASRQRVLENFQHDALHYNLSKNHFVNDMLAWVLIAVPSFRHIIHEREAHCIGHHAHYWQEGIDPDLMRDPEYRNNTCTVSGFLDTFRSVANVGS